MSTTTIFRPKPPASVALLKNVHVLKNCVFINCDQFGKFVRDLLNDLKQNKCTFFNSIIGQLITIYQDQIMRNEHTNLLSRILMAQNVVVTDIKSNVFLKKLKINKFTDNIDYLVLPSFTLWDHNFLVFLNKKFNSKKPGGLVNVWGAMQKISLSQGVIKDLIQNKNGYAGQYLYSTFLNTSSFYTNVQCMNGINEIVPPLAAVQRYYGREDMTKCRAWNTRHPNISQLSTQYSRVTVSNDILNWNVKVGLGTFVGANRDCDGDKEVITFLPYPNSLIDFESLLYCDPKYSFLCFDKNKLSFVSQQIYYLARKMDQVCAILQQYPFIYKLWCLHQTRDSHQSLAQMLEKFFTDVTLMFSSNCATLLFQEFLRIIDSEEMVCEEHEVNNLNGCFEEVVSSGAKGSANLIASTRQYKCTSKSDVALVAQRAINGLNSHITSHGRVKFSGGDIYHNTVVFLNLYLKNFNACYKRDVLVVSELSHLPEQFLFPLHLVDLYL